MANELTIPGGDNKLALPAHIAARFAEDQNILTESRVPSLTIKGKVFTMNANGESTPITKTDDEGNEYPAAQLSVVILDYAVRAGRAYFTGAFDPNDIQAPVCRSKDGVVPDDDVEEKQAEKCGGCPRSIKGSKVTDNNKAVAECSVQRLLAIVPAGRLDLGPMQLKLAQTSMYDGRSPEAKAQNKFAFQNYLDSMKTRGIPNTRSIVTQISFDASQAYPKLFFKALKYCSEDQLNMIDEIMASGAVDEILGETSTKFKDIKPAAIAREPAKPALAAPKKTKAPEPQPEEDEEDAEADAAAAAAAEAEAAAKAKAARIKAKKDAAVAAAAEAARLAAEAEDDEDEDEEETEAAPPPPKTKAKGKPATATEVEAGKEQPKEKFLPEAAAQAKTVADIAGDDEDEGELTQAPPPPKGKKAQAKAGAPKPPATAPAAVNVPKSVEDMLKGWDD